MKLTEFSRKVYTFTLLIYFFSDLKFGMAGGDLQTVLLKKLEEYGKNK